MDEQLISYPSSGNDGLYLVEDKSFWFNLRNNLIKFFVKRYLPEGSTFHDIGGGNGFVSIMLQNELNLNVTMIEPGSAGCENAKRRGVKKVLNKIFSSADLNEEVINVGLFDVLEHIQDADSFLKIIYNKQKSNGIIFVTVPASQFLWSGEDVVAGHYRRYSYKGLSGVVKNAGYENIEIIPFFLILIFPIFLLRALPYRLGKKYKPNIEADHIPSGFITKILTSIINFEIFLAQKGVRFPVGASYLLIARKL